MKIIKTVFSLALSFGMLIACQSNTEGDEIDIPKEVLSAFEKEYANATNAKWIVDDEEFEVLFNIENNAFEASYSADGILLEFEEIIKTEDLPTEILVYIQDAYPHANIIKGEYFNENDTSYYEVEIKSSDWEKDLIFTIDGNFLEENSNTEEAEDDDLELTMLPEPNIVD